jgi:hypothetical protein
LLDHSEKWRLRDNEGPPKKGAFTQLDNDGSDNEGGRKKGKPDGRKKAKDKEKRLAEAASKDGHRLEEARRKECKRWKALREDEARKAVMEERRVLAK